MTRPDRFMETADQNPMYFKIHQLILGISDVINW